MSNTHKDSERRKAARMGVQFIVSYKIDRPAEDHMWVGDKDIDALMLDLSESGMAILTNYDIPVSTILLIKFTLINLYANKDERAHSIEIRGKVLHNVLSEDEKEHRLGISFIQIIKEDKFAI